MRRVDVARASAGSSLLGTRHVSRQEIREIQDRADGTEVRADATPRLGRDRAGPSGAGRTGRGTGSARTLGRRRRSSGAGSSHPSTAAGTTMSSSSTRYRSVERITSARRRRSVCSKKRSQLTAPGVPVMTIVSAAQCARSVASRPQPVRDGVQEEVGSAQGAGCHSRDIDGLGCNPEVVGRLELAVRGRMNCARRCQWRSTTNPSGETTLREW